MFFSAQALVLPVRHISGRPLQAEDRLLAQPVERLLKIDLSLNHINQLPSLARMGPSTDAGAV